MVLIGSGLGEDGAASQAMGLVLANIRADQNLVVDGSALNLWLRKIRRTYQIVILLSPHIKKNGNAYLV